MEEGNKETEEATAVFFKKSLLFMVSVVSYFERNKKGKAA